MFWQLFVVASILAAAYYRWSRRKLYRLAGQIAGLPNSYPIVGHSYLFFGSSEDRMKIIEKIGILSNQHNGFLTFWLGHKLFISMTTPADMAVVSKACLAKDEFTAKLTRTFIGNGSIFAPVNIWHPRRKINAPFFNLKNLNSIVPVFDRHSRTMVKNMRQEIGQDFSTWKYFSAFTFDTVCETSAGTTVDSQGNPALDLVKSIEEMGSMLASRMLQPWLHPSFIYQQLAEYQQFQYHKKCLYTFIDQIVQKRRKEISSGERTNNDGWSNFLDVIIKSSGGMDKGYSDLELREELLVMLVAGNDTSATAACFTAVLLSRHQDVQDKVCEELEAVFGDSDRSVTAEDLTRLKYLEAVIRESLRLYPPVPAVVREITNDILLPSGIKLVKGTSVVLNIWAVHKNPELWGPDAAIFRPERFLDNPMRHSTQYMPFSYSVRGCIGSTYAMFSAKTVLANLLRHYRLRPADCADADLQRPLPVKFDIMMKAVDGFRVRIEEKHAERRRS